MTVELHAIRDDQLPGLAFVQRLDPPTPTPQQEAEQWLAQLSDAERATVVYMAKGLICHEMAALTGLCVRSHQRHIRRACAKLDLRPVELAVLAAKAGLA